MAMFLGLSNHTIALATTSVAIVAATAYRWLNAEDQHSSVGLCRDENDGCRVCEQGRCGSLVCNAIYDERSV